jgi:hypothetical protein
LFRENKTNPKNPLIKLGKNQRFHEENTVHVYLTHKTPPRNKKKERGKIPILMANPKKTH